ncbi:MAG TPA: GNAT family N-acetyltransferase [Hyphomicrobiaceae bacterium]|nr:GNAT family N-acetyltransferase [Hyphomicrobiaceae bacterium]
MPAIRNNAALHRYELETEAGFAVANYRPLPGAIAIFHTEVPLPLRGRNIGVRLVRGALEDVRRQGMKVVPQCSFVRAFMARHPEYQDLLATEAVAGR